MIPSEISDLLDGFNPFKRQTNPPEEPEEAASPPPAIMRPQEGQRDFTPVPPLPETIPSQIPVQDEPSAFLKELTEEPFDYLGFTPWHDELRLVRPINEEGIAIKIIEVLNTHAG